MINVNLPFGANVDRKENGVSYGGPRVEENDETNHDNEGAVLESVTNRDVGQRQVQGKMRVWDMVSS